MKITPNKYLEEKDIEKYLSFTSEGSSHCSLVFLRRLAALARDIGHGMTGIGGRRDSATQQRLWNADLKAHNGVASGKVARPYTSWHEFACAVDLDGDWWKTYSNKNWVPYSRFNQKQLVKYGLMLPLNKVDSPSVIEWWHLQPIETAGISSSKRKDFLDSNDLIYRKGDGNVTIEDFQAMTGLTVDGVADKTTQAKAKEVLQVCQKILGLDYKTAQEAIIGTQNEPSKWIQTLKPIKYSDSFVMNIVNKMGGK